MAQLDIITLHRDSARDTLFSELLQRSLFFDPTIKAWVASGASCCEAMLLSPHLFVAPYRPAYEDMARRHPVYDFANLLFAFKYIPLCLNSTDHKVSRRGIAEYVAARRATVSAAAADIVQRRFGALAAGGQIELMVEVIEPLVKDVLCTLNQTGEAGRALIRNASAIFDRMMGAKKRRELDDELGKIREFIKRSRPNVARTKRVTASRCSSSATMRLVALSAKASTGSFSPTVGVA